MFLPPVARRRIGWSPFCVREDWSISCVSHRNPHTTITTRRFRRSSIRYASQNSKEKQQRDAGIAVGPEKRRNQRNNSQQRKRASRDRIPDAPWFWLACEPAANSRRPR